MKNNSMKPHKRMIKDEVHEFKSVSWEMKAF